MTDIFFNAVKIRSFYYFIIKKVKEILMNVLLKFQAGYETSSQNYSQF